MVQSSTCSCTNLTIAVAVTLIAIGIPWYAVNYKTFSTGNDLSKEESSQKQSVQCSDQLCSSPLNPVPQPYTLLDPTHTEEGSSVPNVNLDISSSQSIYLDKTNLPQYSEQTKVQENASGEDNFEDKMENTQAGKATKVIVESTVRSSMDTVPNIRPTSTLQQQPSVAATKSGTTFRVENTHANEPYIPTKQQEDQKVKVSSSALPNDEPNADGEECWFDYSTGSEVCKPICTGETFSLGSMTSCYPLLTCEDIQEIKVLNKIGEGLVKKVFKAEWKDHIVAYSVLQSDEFKKDFQHGLKMLKHYSNRAPGFIQFLGNCDTSNVIITEFHSLGELGNLEEIFDLPHYNSKNNAQTRFRLCLDYVEILRVLHVGDSLGPRVMCDSNDLPKVLQQFLVTNDLRLVLNDMDALPQVLPDRKIKCGHKQLFGDFVAPEQIWPYEDKPYSDKEMPLYDEKVDIWKIPAVCTHLLGTVTGSDIVNLHLFEVHKKCKQIKFQDRPTAEKVLEEYQSVFFKLYS